MTQPHYISLLFVAIWLVMACLIPFLRAQHRPAAFWAMVLVGVPVLGWLTLHWGPGIGFGTLVLALWVLLRSPLDPSRRRRGNIHSGLH
ncbi:Protein of unknown function [Paracoccus alcaliphilus]|uniref:DUF2484 family protein n=1 Tax=Paracoccus alcaliphilus TaxID=34002 RepID=A0A1H8JPH5_9RHOB|nr:DUF2484 family protein [Paracoccus alcaliphilus]SEN82644.1 Protein of unknown function [Paracoccus alcaliphilus]